MNPDHLIKEINIACKKTISSDFRLKIKDNQVVLRRLGSNSSTMEFEKNKRHRTQYKTPYGSMTMEMLTKSVDVYIKEEPLEIDITIEYDILIKNMFEGRNSMHITVNK